ncbi:hypothetical protein GPZ77_34465 (plasmid) [Streptomyces sp. QHH-9511]|uniref:DUF6221 family protein n=1 Tax=Streptomyces sp. QHH-9511 TaxID=2684468 RepID=UPI0013170320|nr:DUF6221 family protein [Streptomyces sp. QHH-9511]QGZ53336.1 hypothetical protein GPZ77_34465 [Streptomyces sp. QHH-9511]
MTSSTDNGARAPETRAAVYRFWDADDRLLYLGMTHDIDERWKTHERLQPWWLDVVKRNVTWYETRSEAAAVEKAALLAEDPKYDGSGNRGITPQRGERLAFETARATEAVETDLERGTYPQWSILPPYGELSSTYRIPVVAITAALTTMAHRGLLTKIWEMHAVARHDELPRQPRNRQDLVHLLISRMYGDDTFTLTEATQAVGLTRGTMAKHLRKLEDSDHVERSAAVGVRALRYRIIQHPKPVLPKRRSVWGANDLLQLGAWVQEQLVADETECAQDGNRLAQIARDRRIIDTCLPAVGTRPDGEQFLGVPSTTGAVVLVEMAYPYHDRPGYQPEWLPSWVDMRSWLSRRTSNPLPAAGWDD